VVRGGLNGIGPGQREAALSVGLSRMQVVRLVLLPQALARIQPALLGTFVTFVKGSTLVVAIGLYDLLGAAVLSSSNPAWVGHSIEPLVFVGFVFWAVCFLLSRVSARLERRRIGVSAGRRSGSDRRD
jgi:general L-amino acid transport system permease protein